MKTISLKQIREQLVVNNVLTICHVFARGVHIHTANGSYRTHGSNATHTAHAPGQGAGGLL